MARYIDADKFKSHLEKAMEKMHLIGGVKGVDVGAVIMALDRQPTADVEPKSEVENYKQIAEYQQKLAMDRYFEIKRLEEEIETLKDTNEHLAVMLEEAKQEVVGYIEKHLQYQRKKVDVPFASRDMRNYQCGAIDVIEYFEELVAELKKKYTEEKT